jgi:hypothetical protein
MAGRREDQILPQRLGTNQPDARSHGSDRKPRSRLHCEILGQHRLGQDGFSSLPLIHLIQSIKQPPKEAIYGRIESLEDVFPDSLEAMIPILQLVTNGMAAS